MKNEKRTSNLNFNVQLFWKSKNHFVLCFTSQLQHKNKNQNFISNFTFQFIKKTRNGTLGTRIHHLVFFSQFIYQTPDISHETQKYITNFVRNIAFLKTPFPLKYERVEQYGTRNQNLNSSNQNFQTSKFIPPKPNSIYCCQNPKGIRLISRVHVGLSRLQEFKHSFKNCLNPLCFCGNVLKYPLARISLLYLYKRKKPH